MKHLVIFLLALRLFTVGVGLVTVGRCGERPYRLIVTPDRITVIQEKRPKSILGMMFGFAVIIGGLELTK